ncbi:CPBP family intramembrane metalloprotease [Paenibacillus albicereus]|uniref:CPBP family intramembrane metalloprotease n=1 Tax=Paenibacillus albicereus TaxID=2726185 RepID=A0A6H2GW28_9BACL|nr:CPBP family intramembrane glutamic endopeptidase [Paenibacillus albicereus]QJC51348.1 CPBP family intramembrane metalloprotease [Paenibacillus albicereus]
MRTLRALGLALLYVGLYAGILTAASGYLYGEGSPPGLRGWLEANPNGLLLLVNPVVLLLYLVLLRLQRVSARELGLGAPPRGWLALALAGVWLGLFIASFTRLPLVQEELPAIAGLASFVAGGSLPVFLLGSLLLGSLLEELLFRGMLLRAFRLRFGPSVSVLLQALLFGAVFLNVQTGLFAALGALVYGLLRAAGGSLWISLLAHLLSTSAVYAGGKLLQDAPSGLLLAVSSASAAALALHLAATLGRRRRPSRHRRAAAEAQARG